jgi:glycosyltransferase involved in cell wall biosynthesis
MSGQFAQTEAPALFQSAHILLHTKYNDPCPGVVIEAMASGLPVVYSASGGLPELVADIGGKGVPVETRFDREILPDPSALAACVEAVWQDHARYREAARDRAVTHFDQGAWTRRQLEVFGGLLS